MFNVFEQLSVHVGDVKANLGFRNFVEDHIEATGAQIIQKNNKIPQHIAFCMDGNRRFSKKAGLQEGAGHVAGFASMLRILMACHRMGVKVATVYAFSIENFNRSPEESETLFNLVRTNLWDMVQNRDSAMRQLDWQVRFPGHRSMLERDVIERMAQIENITAQSKGMIVNVCAPYTTRDDITTAVATSALKSDVTSKVLENARHLAGAYPLDMFVRTSGETRLSDFMAWEISPGCSLEFIPELWPEFTVWKLYLLVIKWQLKSKKANLLPIDSLAPHPPLVSVSKRPKAMK